MEGYVHVTKHTTGGGGGGGGWAWTVQVMYWTQLSAGGRKGKSEQNRGYSTSEDSKSEWKGM